MFYNFAIEAEKAFWDNFSMYHSALSVSMKAMFIENTAILHKYTTCSVPIESMQRGVEQNV